MSLVFAAIAPHGTLPEAPVPGAEKTHDALAELGRLFDAAAPEATIVMTPHNVHVEGHFAVVLAGTLAGSLVEFDAPDVQLSCRVDVGLAAEAVVALHDDDLPVVGASFGPNDPSAATAPLDWGALIPLWFMGGRSEPQVPAVVVSPARDLSLSDHVRAGRALARAAEASGKRVALIASADHGHAHDPEGPYGFDPAAAEYDERIVQLVEDNRLDGVLDLDPAFVEAAKADSWWQLAMLHGALGTEWTGTFLSYEASTYFGMLCAAYAPN
ncbi:MAG: extradiol ring-cleavage dioxygenase [Actinobacteria bacterium]|nr:extradiol ring-cleavage dioxygenase [Actinomycetota bacterium]